MKGNKQIVVFLALVLVISLVCGISSKKEVQAEGATYTRTYTQMKDYDYGEKNKGFYMVPDEPGQYPVIFMFHGAGQDVSSNWEYRSYLMDTVNKWIALGYMDPMVIVVPNIEREDEKDDWSCYGFFYYVNKGRFKTVLNKIKNGETEFDAKVDHSKKFSVTGFSMGGVESLLIGTTYKDDILNIGACSPSYMYYHMTGTSDDGWVKKDKVNFTDDPNAHLFMGYGIQESGFRDSVERYDAVYRENKTAEQKDFVIYGSYDGGHTWDTFSREIFCFVYYMKFDVLPDAETVEKACKDRNLNYEGSGSAGGNSGSGTGGIGNATGGSGAGGSETGNDISKKLDPSNEWINGKWYDANGAQNYEPTAEWKYNDKGWWMEDSSGWYPKSQWQKIDGYWYYFDESGYMASNEWRDGYWLSSIGSLEYEYTASWKHNSSGWWFEDGSGWYPQSQWQKIDGCWYYFDVSGYMVTNQYVDGYWIGVDGICQ